jgi:hypothetical protein
VKGRLLIWLLLLWLTGCLLRPAPSAPSPSPETYSVTPGAAAPCATCSVSPDATWLLPSSSLLPLLHLRSTLVSLFLLALLSLFRQLRLRSPVLTPHLALLFLLSLLLLLLPFFSPWLLLPPRRFRFSLPLRSRLLPLPVLPKPPSASNHIVPCFSFRLRRRRSPLLFLAMHMVKPRTGFTIPIME